MATHMNNIINNCSILLLLATLVLTFSANTKAQSPQNLYNSVQNLYAQSSSISKDNCSNVERLIVKISKYTGYRTAVPANKAYSVSFPNKVNNPTIGDLANDRIARLKSQFKSCFTPKRTEDPNSVRLYNEVQNIYTAYNTLNTNNCNRAEELVTRLGSYSAYRYAVPQDKAYSVNFPSKISNPTIGDLAKDRIARVKSHVKPCFTGQRIVGYYQKNLVGTWKYIKDGREFHLTIIEDGTSLKASFSRHGYSYPPHFTSAEMASPHHVNLNFQLAGGTHKVTIQVGYTPMGTSSSISESWDKNGMFQNVGVMQKLAKNSSQAPRNIAVDVTFLNQTNGEAKIYWIKNGEEIAYKTLKPSQSYVQGTFSSHKWLVKVNNQAWLNYTASKDKSQLVRIR